MENIHVNQAEIFEAMTKLSANIMKDSSSRKVGDYFKRRLETLESYWVDFQYNHDRLSTEESRSHPYFIQKHYERAAELYRSVKALISQQQGLTKAGQSAVTEQEVKLQQRDDQPSGTSLASMRDEQASKRSSPERLSRGTSSKTDDMLKKQSSNIKAFQRTIASINLEEISEKWEMEDALKTIQSRWSVIDTLHWELDGELEEMDEHYEQSYSKQEKIYNDLKKVVNSKLWSVAHKVKSTPKLDIPIFSGSYQQWTSFKDLFTETIHTNYSLSSAQKMQHLKSKLRGEPEKLIQHLPISSDNYNISWDILNHRYNNLKLICSSHLDTLINIPAVQHATINHIKRLHDTTVESLNAIKNLGVDVTSWDPLLIHLLSPKLDSETYDDYAESIKDPRALPKLQDFLSFLEGKFTSMESSRRKQDNQSSKSGNFKQSSFEAKQSRQKFYSQQSFIANGEVISQPTNNKNVNQTKNYRCPICKTNEHCTFYCQQFLQMSPQIKRKTLSKLDVCKNCLYSHNGNACFSTKRCRECNGNHNTLLHAAFTQSNNASIAISTSKATENTTPATKYETPQLTRGNSHVSLQQNRPDVLLPTAMIKVQAEDGSFQILRALLDQGSQTSLISENAAQLLGISRKKCPGVIWGIGETETNCKGIMSIKCASIINSFEFEVDVYIMNKLVKNLPNRTFNKPTWSYLDNISLADPDFNISRSVDLLLGSRVYSKLLLEGVCREFEDSASAQNTRLGWILSGDIIQSYQCNVILHNLEEIQQFWEIEDITDETSLSSGDQQTIDYYQKTTIRQEDGRYQVRLPLKPNFSDKLGFSKPKAVAQFKSLERKFQQHPNVQADYQKFMTEYQELGHMKLASNSSKPDCFLTHHNVLRPDSTTTKFRVVFNASAKTSTGNSLNDVMEAGPNLQQDLQSLILKWRQYKFAYTADIEKMFRQIWIHEDDQRYQKIVWRNTSSDPRRQNNPIQDYQLTTVTYGTKAAPFLSLMTLKQLARDERANNKNNLATDVLENSFYVDDLLHGSHSPESAKTLTRDLIKLLKSGGFNLRKWKSNVPELLEHIQTDNKTQDSFNFKQSEPSKTLGLIWDPKEDTFRFELKIELSTSPVTKRSLLSDISKLFDPLGWLSPLSTRLKIIFQKVWIHDIKWDDPLPKDILTDWISVRDTIYRVNQLQLPRWIGTQERDSIELHGFCDASQKAYACVIYCRIKGHKQSMPILLVGKTRLVPSSKSVSLPRLELSGALLLSKLISKVQQCLTNYNVTIYGWVDSMVVLGWLNGDPTRWKSFVANRVRQITNIMPTNCWQYVKSSENPADCASRGLTAAQLKDHSLWWKGPSWLSTYDAKKESKLSNFTTNEEIKNNKLQVNVTQQNNDCSVIRDLISKYSSFTQLINVYARLLRYFKRLRLKQMVQTKHLTLQEIRQAKMKLIKFVQETDFFEDIQNLQQGKPISSKSKILNLNPFLDQDGILRVGGRLNRANIDPQMKHPIILSKTCRLAELIIDESHFLTFHGGPQLTSAFTRQKYWIVGGIRAVKIRVRRCVKCRRHNPSNQHQIMGDLPPGKWAMGRVNQVHPGSDGYVRVVTLQTKNGSMRRPIFKLTPLPDFSDEEDKQVSTSDQSHQNIKTSPQLKTRTSQSLSSTYTTIVSLLLLLLCLVCNVHSAYNITQLQGNQAIYFDKISEMNLIQDQWKIVVYYDMHPYWHGSNIFSIYMNHLENLCTQTKRRSHCDVIMLQLRHKFMELEYYDRMLLNQHFEAHTRTRRGLINGIGYVANSLFGVLDEHFAEQYQKDITLVRKNQKHLALLWRNQTSIIEAENNLLKRVESTMEKQHKIFNQHLINLDQALSTLKNEVEKVAVTEDFILSTLIASNILSSLKNIQDSLLDTITNVQHFNVHLITPAQLQDELNIISNQLPKELSLPINSITTDLYKIYQIMQVRARMTREYFIFEIQIPLVNRESYEIYHMIPIQHQIKGSMVNVVLISEYIAINIRKDIYLPISGYELQKCIRLNANTNLCQLQKPIYQRDSDQNFCIKNQEGNTCTTITATCKTTWTQLNVINTFIITCCGHCTLRIICGDQVTTEQVTGVKIIALGNNCVIKGETFIITSHKQQTTNMKIKPDIIAVEIAPVNNLINLSIPTNEYKEERYQTSLQNISKQIEQMKAASEQTDDGVTYHDVHHYVAIYCVGVAGLAFAAFANIRSRRRRRTVQLAPTPAQPGVHYRASTSDLRATSMPNQSDQCASEVYHSDQRASVTNNSNACVTDRATSPVIRKCSFKTSTNNLAI